ncbi:hypothetical protein BB560_001182 [Smittium megazygosporum]|uniref:Uncharacterized protein n=1 Tax=Smittium megazygosporum TaxID=133381 RepID=A0A2T9ZIC9_9FUNG|nr:hypothetical protein BB560_001182 [Smittium megazygosporum]
MYSQLESQPQQGSSSSDQVDQEQHVAVSRYATVVPIRIDIEAALCYVFFCFSGVLLLIFERENDFIRFHAYQSTLLSISSFFSILVLGSVFGSYTIFFIIAFILNFYMAYRAYKDSSTLDYYLLPVIGKVAFEWTASE